MLPYSLTAPGAIRYIACMEIFLVVCLTLLVLELGAITVMAGVALLQVYRTARAMEVLTLRVDGQVAAFGETVRSGWTQILQSVIGLCGRWLCRN